MDELLPYRVSYSDGKEKCQKCRHKIGKDYMQIAIMIQSNEDDCRYPTWYHQQCFFETRLPATEAAFDGFSLLRYDHQMAIKKDLGFGSDSEEPASDTNVVRDFLQFVSNIDLNQNDNQPIHTANDDHTVGVQKEIRCQNDEYYGIYDYVVKNVSKDDQIKILDFNGQVVPDTDEQIIHHLVDVICFGALNKCKSCKNGQLQFRNWIYKCTYASEWTTCDNEDNKPPRRFAKIPPELLSQHPFLQAQRGNRARMLHAFNVVDEDGNDLVYGPYKKPLLFNMEFVLSGKFKKPKVDIEQLIKKLGGKVGTEIHARVAAVISTVDEVEKMGQQMKDAKLHGIQVVSEEFLDEIQKPDADPILYINSKSISDWAGDLSASIEENEVSTRRETIFYTKSLPEKITLKWKDGGAVDPECGLKEQANVFFIQIYQKKLVYSVVLGLVDIEHNKNSYFRMQLLESNDQNTYWVFKSWGRTGTVIGSKQLKKYGSLIKARKKFHSMYERKTGNKFGLRNVEKQHNKFYHLDVEDGMPREIPHTFIATKLDAPVYELMQMLFDVEEMENLMCTCDLDLKQMPLGKISAKQIKMAMSALCSIAKLIQRKASAHEFRDASNKFYTLIPHSFGIDRPPIIDTIETLTAKQEMLESLLNMGTIYSFLENENGEKVHPLDACYDKLNANIVPITKDSNEFRLLSDIVRNTHGPEPYQLGVLEIFKVVRNGEDEQFQNQLPNHQLLWHGSRRMNFANILSNGLKVAPPEATANGYLFGKGIYFTDVVSKSANYCFTNAYNDTGLMLLCEVALGNSYITSKVTPFDNIPNADNQSVKGLGAHYPTQWQYIDGILAPHSGLSESSANLRYNEYVVYDMKQVKIKYLFKMKFYF